MSSKKLRIFVLADTHDRLPDNLAALAEGADEIWHLGDVCSPSLLLNLESVGPPVTLVRGNSDSNFEWPLVVDLKRNGVRVRLAIFRHRVRRRTWTSFYTPTLTSRATNAKKACFTLTPAASLILEMARDPVSRSSRSHRTGR